VALEQLAISEIAKGAKSHSTVIESMTASGKNIVDLTLVITVEMSITMPFPLAVLGSHGMSKEERKKSKLAMLFQFRLVS
jgi:hypothetical protein